MLRYDHLERATVRRGDEQAAKPNGVGGHRIMEDAVPAGCPRECRSRIARYAPGRRDPR